MYIICINNHGINLFAESSGGYTLNKKMAFGDMI